MIALSEQKRSFIFEPGPAGDGVTPVDQLPLARLEAACAVETARYLRGRSADATFGYELFRRALDLRLEPAWAAVWRVYGELIIGWARAHPAAANAVDDAEFFANRALERLWLNVACKPGKFTRFPNLAAVLRFLKMCVHSAVVDDGPNRPPADVTHVPLVDVAHTSVVATPLDLSPLNKGAFWQAVDELLTSDEERIVMFGHFYYGYKNRELYARYPDRFRDVKQLANLRLTVLRRLARRPAFAEMLRDLLDATAGGGRHLIG